MATTNYLQDIALNYVLRNVSGTAPSALYVALFVGDPAETTSAEVSGGSYARQTIAFVASLAGETRNTAAISFGTSTADWGEVTHYAVYDALTTGNLLFSEAFEESFEVESGTAVSIEAGTLIVALE